MVHVIESLPRGGSGPVYPTVDTKVADDLATQITRASAAIVLLFSRNIPVSASEGLSVELFFPCGPLVDLHRALCIRGISDKYWSLIIELMFHISRLWAKLLYVQWIINGCRVILHETLIWI